MTFTAAGACTVTGANVHLTGVGTCTITAAQPGNDDYAAATPVQQAFTVEQPLAPILDTFNRGNGAVGSDMGRDQHHLVLQNRR